MDAENIPGPNPHKPSPHEASPYGPAATPPGATAPACPPATPRNGTVAWALGFLAYVPIPFVNVLVAGLAQLVVGLRQRRHGGLAAENGVRAANWGLTQLSWPVLMAVALTIAALTGEPSATGDGVRFIPVMTGIVFTLLGLYFVLGLLQLVYAIVGTVQANKGARVRLPVIPFLRGARDGSR